MPTLKIKENQDLITGDEIEFRTDGKQQMVMPAGMTYSRAFEILRLKKEEDEKVTAFQNVFTYRPLDGAHATAIVMKRRYGITVGKETTDMFGEKHPPQVRTIPIGPGGQKTQVPWGQITIPQLPNTVLELAAVRHNDYGVVFAIQVQGPRKIKKEMNDFFADVEKELRVNSIYRGKAISGTDEPVFIEDLAKFESDKIVFADQVDATLDAGLFSVLRHPEAMRQDGIPLKRAVLLYGPYGTGKTSVGMMTAKEATASGWTFVMARPGRDDVGEVLQTARLYAPAVVWIEDIDTDTQTTDPKRISKLLDTFDGIGAKGGEIIMALTTNHVDRIPPGMLRPGRLDYTIEIADLDRSATERLIRVVVSSDKLDELVNFDAVYAEMGGFLPAFVKATCDRAKSWAINRLNGSLQYTLTTADLVGAAKSLHAQLALHASALDTPTLPALDKVFREVVADAVDGSRFVDSDGDSEYHLARAANGSR